MPQLRKLRGTCPDDVTCPAIRVGPDEDLYVQGYVVNDPDLLAELNLPPGETVVHIPATAAAVLLPELTERSTLG